MELCHSSTALDLCCFSTGSFSYNYFPSLSKGSRYSVLENGSLLVDPVRHGDSGCYTCSASNPGGRSSANVQLIVTRNGRPTAGSVAASLCVSGNNIWNDNSTTLTPACSLATGPVATTAEGCRVLEDVSRSDHSRAPIETASGGSY